MRNQTRMMPVADWRVQRCPGCGHLTVALEAGLPLLIETSLGDQPRDLPRAGEDIQEFREFLEQISADDFRAFDTDPTSPDR